MTTHAHTKTTPDVPITTTSSRVTSPVVTLVATPPPTPPAPSTTSSAVVLSATPPVVTLPTIPVGYIPLNLRDFGGIFPRKAQVEAAPDVVDEVSTSTIYIQTFGPAAPAAEPFTSMLGNAVIWTTNRVTLETYLQYAKGQEGLAWKAVAPDLEQLKAVYEVTVGQNTQIPKQFPALTRFFATTATSAKKSSATRKRNKAAKAKEAAAATTPSTTTTAAPSATSPSTTTGTTANGGAAH